MAVKILIKRHFKESDYIQISKMLNASRYRAMEQEGYISSETMWDLDDPKKVVVASMWQTIDNWNAWKNSEQRKSVESQYADRLDGPAVFEHYFIGMYPH